MLTGSADKLIDFISVSHTTPTPYWPDIHMFTDQGIVLPPSRLSFGLFLFLSHCISCVPNLSSLCCVLSTSLSLTQFLFLLIWRQDFLNLVVMSISTLALALREDGGQAEEPLFSRPFLWMKRWNEGMKALGKVWKLHIHQCKEILR